MEQTGHYSKDCPKGIICNFCGEEGHKSFDCSYAKEARKKVKEKGGEEAKKAAEHPSTDKGQSKKPAVGLVVRAAQVEEMAIQPIDGGACRL